MKKQIIKMGNTLEERISEGLANGQESAMNLIDANYRKTFFFVSLGILNNETLSHDAVQESMIKIWDNRAKYNSTKGRLYTWMLKIVRNKTIDVQRAFNTRNFKEDSIDDANHVVHISSPSERNFNSMFVRHHVRSLKFKYQSVINALFFEELSQEEAAEKLDIPLGTVKSRKKIAIRELRKIYENEI